MEFYALTDPLRSGDVIMADGRKFYRFVFGSFQWERTTILLPYLTSGTPLYGKFRTVQEDEAQKLLLEKGRKLKTLLQRAERMAKMVLEGRTTPEGEPELERVKQVSEALTDLEERIVYLLYSFAGSSYWDGRKMKQEGFTPQIYHAVDLLIRKEGVTAEAYLTQVRKNRISRNVLLMDLSSRMEQAGENTEQIRKARQFLYGDISSYQEEPARKPETVFCNLVPAMKIYQLMDRIAYDGRKIPHGLSNPVLRMADGRLCLAFFAYTFSYKNLQEKKIPRPSIWMLADLATGELIRKISCKDEDFSEKSFEELCSTESSAAAAPDFQQIYGLFDTVRQRFLEGGTLDREAYEEYLEQMLQAVPPSYHCFYQELSKV